MHTGQYVEILRGQEMTKHQRILIGSRASSLRTGIAMVCAVVLMGCATPYQAQGFRGGFTETRFDETTYQIAFKGNAFISPDTVQKYVLYRAAELTIQSGFDHFVIVGAQDRTQTAEVTTGGTATTRTTYNAFTPGTATARSTTTYSPEQRTQFTKPGQSVTIKMGKGPKPERDDAYVASTLITYLGPSVQ
jgi:hypothetical protein